MSENVKFEGMTLAEVQDRHPDDYLMVRTCDDIGVHGGQRPVSVRVNSESGHFIAMYGADSE